MTTFHSTTMQVPLWIWLATVGGIVALLALSFFAHIRKAHEPSIKEAAAWTAFFVTLSVLFGIGLHGVREGRSHEALAVP